MNNIFNELPTAFPFYDDLNQINGKRENVENLCAFKLVSPKNALLPFQIRMNTAKPNPIKWEIYSECDNGFTSPINISENLSKVKIYVFDNVKQAVYFGDALTVSGNPLNLVCGAYVSKFTFSDGTYFISEVFYVPENKFNVGESNEFMMVEFWNDADMEPILYRDNFRQRIYLDTFVHSAVPEMEEESAKDGVNNAVPIWQKLTLKYKFTDVVPDFVKIVLVTLQMKDNIYLYLNRERRSGKIDRVLVTATPDDTGSFNAVDVVFEDDIIVKASCVEENTPSQITHW